MGVKRCIIVSDNVKKEVTVPERNSDITITGQEILVIDNDQAICPICVEGLAYIQYWCTLKSLGFVTSTHGVWAENKLRVDTGISNTVKIVKPVWN